MSAPEIPTLTIYPAGAGSGKTYQLQNLLADWIESGGVEPEKVAALTFTKAAAGELKTRLRAELIGRHKIGLAARLDDAYVSTYHAFGNRLVREFCFEAGLAPELRHLEPSEQKLLLRKAIASIQDRLTAARDLARFGFEGSTGASGYTSAAESFSQAIQGVVAKLRTIGETGERSPDVDAALQTIRETYPDVEDPDRLTTDLHNAVTAALKAYPEDPSVHFIANKTPYGKIRKDYRALVDAADRGRLRSDWALWGRLQEQKQSLVSTRIGKKLDFSADFDARFQRVCEAAAKLSNHPGPLGDMLALVQELFDAGRHAIGAYGEMKQASGLVDYGDMLTIARGLLEQPEVIAELKRRIGCLVVDEFQDTNPLEFEMLWRLHLAGIPMVIVGDVKQAIMSVQEADPRLMEALLERHSGACETLGKNWRAAPEIMNWVNAVGPGLFPGTYTQLEPQEPPSDSPAPLTVWRAGKPRSRKARAGRIGALVAELLASGETVRPRDGAPRPLRGSDVALLCPTNRIRDEYSAALSNLGIATRVPIHGWYASREIGLVRQALAWVADPGDRHAALFLAVTELGETNLRDALTSCLDGGIPDDPVLRSLAAVQGRRDRGAVIDLVTETIDALDLHDRVARWPNGAQARANLLRLEHEAATFTEAPTQALDARGLHGSDLRAFLAWVSLRAEESDGMPRDRLVDRDAVQLSTWHGAKGLEWPVVVACELSYCWPTILPTQTVEYADFGDLANVLEGARVQYHPGFLDDEVYSRFVAPLVARTRNETLRLLYVALTRARQKLILDWVDEAPPGSFQSLLTDAGVSLAGNELVVKEETFPTEVVSWEESEDEDAATTPVTVLPTRRLDIPRCPRDVSATPMEVSPSSLEGLAADMGDLIEHPVHDGLDISLDLLPTERGSLVHRAFEILGVAPGAADRLPALLGVDLDDTQRDALSRTSATFEAWVREHFSTLRIRREVPVSGLDTADTLITGVIDLLVETMDGYWILDHKSDEWTGALDLRFAHYAPQLEAYRIAAQSQTDRPVLGVGIHWIHRGVCSLMRVKD